ncbi:glycerol-3-phosphate dehydrogenase/oxidase [Pseudoxanthobacter sp.]|uniref:glycerol-3-phosphate dehydrogenase/oxidase n=1 Tax=Pseudoxanthobacter sp. TaxID=1925742 RepID=UPI002FDFF35D
MQSRADQIRRLAAQTSVDVLIIGGGINGVGVMRDLAAQGVACLLAEQGDFGGGTSAAPSRLIHGGLRYLETGEFALVRESVEERNLLLHNAAHVVRPIRVWVPVRGWLGGLGSAAGRALRLIRTPSSKGGCVVAMGLWVYDWFGRAWRSMPGHRMVSRREALATMPSLMPGISVIGEYYDARITHPERLVAELVADAEADCPQAMAINYLAVTGRSGGTVELTDRVSGERFSVTPRLVINTAGPWVDVVDGRLGYDEKLMGGTKGSHLVIRAPELVRELGDTMLYFETPDHRVCLIYRMEGDLFLLGTTDLRTSDPADVVCSPAEIDYLFRVLREVLPKTRLGPASIVFHYAGVRPLPASRAGATGAISRDHKLHVREPDDGRPFALLTLVGGKWTTYRACAEQIADAVLARLGTARRTSTKHLRVGGGRGLDAGAASLAALSAQVATRSGLPQPVADRLTARYGSGALAIAEAMAAGPDRPVAGAPSYSRAEIAWLAQNERVERLEDIVLRRTLIAFEGLAVPEVLADLAEIVGAALGWNRARREEELAATVALMAARHGVPAALAAAA